MSSYVDISLCSSPYDSLSTSRCGTPNIIESTDFTDVSLGAINLADELAMAEEVNQIDQRCLSPTKGYMTLISNNDDDDENPYYQDIDHESNLKERQLNELADEVFGINTKDETIERFVKQLRDMRGQLDMENHTLRFFLLSSQFNSS